MIDLLNNTKNNASAVVQRPKTVQESPANNVQQVAVKPQAATALNINSGESPGKIVKPQTETIPDGHRGTSAHQSGILTKKRLRNSDPLYIGKKGEGPPRTTVAQPAVTNLKESCHAKETANKAVQKFNLSFHMDH